VINPSRRYIIEAIAADRHLDEALAKYAEHGEPAYLAAVLDLSRRVTKAAEAEAKRIGRLDLAM